MTIRYLALFTLALVACGGGQPGHNSTTGDGGTINAAPMGPNADYDKDGYTPAQGDCNDSTNLVGPNSVEVANNGIDDDCDGKVDNAGACDTGTAGQTTATALTQALGVCATKFVTSSSFVGPSDPMGRAVVNKLGVISPLEGDTMVILSTGLASGGTGYNPQPGTALDGSSGTNEYPNPVVTLKLPPGNACGTASSAPEAKVQDYTELLLELTVPYNANAFSFQSQFFSAEYPEFVCKDYNDRFLVIYDDNTGNPQNVEFDMQMNTISVDNGFFSVCENSDDHPPQTMHCMHPITDIMGSGYDQPEDDFGGGSAPVGGSTGWLTTTVPVTPGDKIKLRFIIYDEGDSIYDSAALIDNFQWSTGKVSGPITVQ